MNRAQRLLPSFDVLGQEQRTFAAFDCAKPAIFYHLVN